MLTAVKLELFTLLAARSLSEKVIKRKLGLGIFDRHVFDCRDALVSVGFLERIGLLEDSVYSNAADTDLFLDKNNKSYMGGILEMASSRWPHMLFPSFKCRSHDKNYRPTATSENTLLSSLARPSQFFSGVIASSLKRMLTT